MILSEATTSPMRVQEARNLENERVTESALQILMMLIAYRNHAVGIHAKVKVKDGRSLRSRKAGRVYSR